MDNMQEHPIGNIRREMLEIKTIVTEIKKNPGSRMMAEVIVHSFRDPSASFVDEGV